MPHFQISPGFQNLLIKCGKTALFFWLAGFIVFGDSGALSLVRAGQGGPPISFQDPQDTLPNGALKTIVDKTPQELMQTYPQLEGLEPAADQKDLPMILEKVGANVEAYFHNFISTSAQEEVVQQRLRPNGKVDESLKQKFRYLLISTPGKRDFDLQEYRMNKKGRPARQKVLWGGALTSGFASMPALLHPALQEDSEFSYLGRQNTAGHDTFVVAFAQIPGVTRFREKIGRKTGAYTVYLEGLVWIDSSNFQIIRIRTEVLPGQSVKSIMQQITEITFSEVHFAGIPVVFWLPQEVVVETDRVDGRFRNDHRYSDYQLYASQTKIISDGVSP